MTETTANIAVIVATVFTVTFLLPQIVKLIKTKDSAGVSMTWASLGFANNVGWFVYLIGRELWLSILAPFIVFLSYGVTVWALWRIGHPLKRAAWSALGWAAMLATVATIGGWDVFGLVLGVSYGFMLAPSIWTAYRTENPSGIAPGTWWIGLLEGALWGVYGSFHDDGGLMVFAAVGIIGSLLMLARYYSTRNRALISAA